MEEKGSIRHPKICKIQKYEYTIHTGQSMDFIYKMIMDPEQLHNKVEDNNNIKPLLQELFGNIIDHVHERKEVHKNFIEYTQQILTTTEQQQIVDMFGGKNLK